MILYRYLSSARALDALQREEWKVGRFNELNDPLDCRPVVAKTDDPANPFAHPNYLNSLSENIGLLCYSLKIDDPVIWSHYADKHHGIAFGFEFTDGKGVFSTPSEVLYSDKRAVIDPVAMHANVSKGNYVDEVIAGGYLQKAKSWEYEKEYRQFVSLSGQKIIGAHYFVTFPMEYLRLVVLGVRCGVTRTDVGSSIGLFNNKIDFKKLRIERAKMDESEYRLKFVDLTNNVYG